MSIMVIAIHSRLFFTTDILFAFGVNGVFRLAVPFFFVISGFYFSSVFIVRDKAFPWFRRLLFMYFIWMIVYSPFWLDYESFDFIVWLKIIKTLLFGYHHLWFFPALILSGVMVYLARGRRSQLCYSACALFFVGVFVQYYINFHLKVSGEINGYTQGSLLFLYRNFLFVGFPFFTLGYIVSTHKKIILRAHKYIYVSLFVFFVEVLFAYLNFGVDFGFDIYLTLPLVITCLFSLCYFYEQKKNNPLTSNPININWATLSASLYFVHPLVLFLVPQSLDTEYAFISCVLFSLLLSFVLFKIKKTFNLKYVI
nr:hypothetical protein BCU06_11730 [Vibrio breoganii]